MRLLLALSLLALAGCSREALQVYNTVPDFELTSSSGSVFKSKDKLAGHVWIADFIYTNCPGPCPRMTSVMRKLVREIDADSKGQSIRFVSFSVDPARDTPAILQAYADRVSAPRDRWYFLTGDVATLEMLDRRAFLLGDVDGKLEHSTRFVLVDERNRVRGYYDSLSQEDLNKLKSDALHLVGETS